MGRWGMTRSRQIKYAEAGEEESGRENGKMHSLATNICHCSITHKYGCVFVVQVLNRAFSLPTVCLYGGSRTAHMSHMTLIYILKKVLRGNEL